ncbi:MAG: carbohydrate ABC transporter permease [Clostridiaceae bacterium]|nr:carbohydrate ABC transporter permease [Clostridiaceae bacterium]
MVQKQSVGEQVFNIANIIFMIILSICTIYPFWNVFITSISPPGEANAYSLHLYTLNPTWQGYQKIMQNAYLLVAYRNTILRTVVGTSVNVFLSCLVAYPLSKKYLPLRNVWTGIIVFTMFFSGGLIPSYLLMKSLNLVGRFWALILPGAIGTYNMIIVRNYFQSLPADIEESARIDGASELRVLLQIVLPISVPIIATVSLWYAVGHWNAWFDAMIYTSSDNLMVLQLLLRKMVIEGSSQYMESSGVSAVTDTAEYVMTPSVIKTSAIIVATLPIMCVYPFIQKYFMKGIMVGSLKG